MARGLIFFLFSIFFIFGNGQGCVTDAQCRSDSNCNAFCDTSSNTCMSNDTVTTCSFISACYESVGKCYPKCQQSSDCLAYSFLLHNPYKGVCNQTTGKCSDCLTTSDCLPGSLTTCGAYCAFNPLSKEFLCYNGNICKNGKVCSASLDNITYSCISEASFDQSTLMFMLLFVLGEFLIFLLQ